MPRSSHTCKDRRYFYFTRNTCNRYVDRSKILFKTQSQACFAIFKAIWGPGLTKIKLHIRTSPAFPLCLSAYSYRLINKFNRAPLNYSKETFSGFPSGGYTHAAL